MMTNIVVYIRSDVISEMDLIDRIKANAERFRKLYYPGCAMSKVEIADCKDLHHLRRLAIMYRHYISMDNCSRYIASECSDDLVALGLRLQLYVDGRARLYLI